MDGELVKRTDYTQLPEIRELLEILKKEAKRPVAAGKEKLHYVDFSLAIEWLQLFGLSVDVFLQDLPWQELAVRGREIQNDVVPRTLDAATRNDPAFADLARRITAYLGEEDAPSASDIIFVFGSKSLKRIEMAVDLYRKGLAPKIFISGGMPIYEKHERSEAQVFKTWAVERGVPEEAIATHDTAISIPDNVRGGLNMLDALKLQRESLILVTAWFAMRRSWATMMKYVPKSAKLHRVAAAVEATGNFAPGLWWKNETGIKTIFNEFGKARISEALNTS